MSKILDIIEKRIVEELEQRQEKLKEIEKDEYLKVKYENELQRKNLLNFMVDKYTLVLTDRKSVERTFYCRIYDLVAQDWYLQRIKYSDVVYYNSETKTGKVLL